MKILHWLTTRDARIVALSCVNSIGVVMSFADNARTAELKVKLLKFFDEHIYPQERACADELASNRRKGDAFATLQTIERLKPIARAAGLWNLFLPRSTRAPEGLSNLEY